MECTSIPFDQLPFSRLFQRYVGQDPSIISFFETNPFKQSSVNNFIRDFKFVGQREKSAEALKRFNQTFGAGKETFEQIEKLSKNETLAIVTGQQLSVYGGPLYTAYKTITAIIYARRWEKTLNRPIVPVFWMADEDHDFEEAATLGLLASDQFKEFEIREGDSDFSVGRRKLDKGFIEFREKVLTSMPESELTGNLVDILDSCYREGTTYRDAFGRFMLKLFGEHGLVLASSDFPEIKKLVFKPLEIATARKDDIYELLNNSSRKLEENGYHRQAHFQEANLFYMDEKAGRLKLDFKDNRWFTGNGHHWKGGELEDEIQKKPESFSPNVFLRPIMQDRLIPTIAYIAGPGEIAYYAQMKDLYRLMEQPMPVVVPRFSATLIEPAIDRIMNELPFELPDYSDRIEDLESEFIQQLDTADIESIFEDWKKKSGKITDKKARKIAKIDPTLEASAMKAGKIFENELDKLKKKVYRSIKKDEEIQLNRIRRIKTNLFPGDGLQERQVAFISFMNIYGTGIWDRLINTLNDEVPDKHKMIKL